MSIPAISENKYVRFGMLFTLYLAQGLPIGLFLFAIPAWLAESGASVAQIGSFSFITTLPWTLKFINGFFLDRFVYLPMGRRRAWLMAVLPAMVIFLVVLALIDPQPTEIKLLAWLSFSIMLITTFQDTAIDGMAADLVPAPERATANGFMFGGQLLGIAIGSALTGYMITNVSFEMAMWLLAGIMSIVVIAVLVVRERPGERILPWTSGNASEHSLEMQSDNIKEIVVLVLRALFTWNSIKLIGVLLISSVTYGIYTSVMPKLAADLVDWTTQDYSGLSGTVNLVAGFFCLFVFGWIADKIGRKQFVIILLVLQCLLIGWALADQAAWATDNFVRIGAFGVIIVRYGLIVPLAAIAMSLCNLRVSATQFTLYMACSNWGLAIAYSLVGWLDKMGGYEYHMIAFAAMTVLSLLVAFTLKGGGKNELHPVVD